MRRLRFLITSFTKASLSDAIRILLVPSRLMRPVSGSNTSLPSRMLYEKVLYESDDESIASFITLVTALCLAPFSVIITTLSPAVKSSPIQFTRSLY